MKPRLWILASDSGATAIDMAFSMLLLAVFIVGAFQFAFGYWILNSMQLAVEEGGRWAIAHHICPIGGGSTYPNCDPSGLKLPPGTCLDPTDSSRVTPTAQQVVYSALPGAAVFFGPDATTAVQISWGGGVRCPSTPSASSPATLGLSVRYSNFFLWLAGFTLNSSQYSVGSADTVPLQ